MDRALDECDATELFQAKEMVRYAADGRAVEYGTLEWQGKYLSSRKERKAVGYWGRDEWYVRDYSDNRVQPREYTSYNSPVRFT